MIHTFIKRLAASRTKLAVMNQGRFPCFCAYGAAGSRARQLDHERGSWFTSVAAGSRARQLVHERGSWFTSAAAGTRAWAKLCFYLLFSSVRGKVPLVLELLGVVLCSLAWSFTPASIWMLGAHCFANIMYIIVITYKELIYVTFQGKRPYRSKVSIFCFLHGMTG